MKWHRSSLDSSKASVTGNAIKVPCLSAGWTAVNRRPPADRHDASDIICLECDSVTHTQPSWNDVSVWEPHRFVSSHVGSLMLFNTLLTTFSRSLRARCSSSSDLFIFLLSWGGKRTMKKKTQTQPEEGKVKHRPWHSPVSAPGPRPSGRTPRPPGSFNEITFTSFTW